MAQVKHPLKMSYAKKRRLLREHMVQMRVAEDLIEDAGLTDEYHAGVMAELGNVAFWLASDDGSGGLGENSDTEDPETALRRGTNNFDAKPLINKPALPQYKTFKTIKP